jgi:hypothetical protein
MRVQAKRPAAVGGSLRGNEGATLASLTKNEKSKRDGVNIGKKIFGVRERLATGSCRSARHLKQFVAAFATVAALFKVRAAHAPAKIFGALAVNSLLHSEVCLAANNDAVFHSRLSHSRVSKSVTKSA